MTTYSESRYYDAAMAALGHRRPKSQHAGPDRPGVTDARLVSS